jgi:hypothetical protein
MILTMRKKGWLMMKGKKKKDTTIETLMLPVPVMNGVRYLDHKDCVALATHPEEGFHIAFEFGAYILAVEYLPQNYPAIDVMVYKRREDWIKSLSSVEWIVASLRHQDYPCAPDCPPELAVE